jgi:quercetin dioxygenase-like cupin family protein
VQLEPRHPPTTDAPAERFTGQAWVDVLAPGSPPSLIRVRLVHFAPGARNAWHSHANGQTLCVTEGRGRVQARGGRVIEVQQGDTIYTPPGEWHWHGATPEHFMSHLAIWQGLSDGEGPESEWGDHVTDEEYNG